MRFAIWFILLLVLLPTLVCAAPVSLTELFRGLPMAQAYSLGDRNQGYYRTEFSIPSGTIWRSIVNIGEQGILYVNGQKVDFKPDFFRRQGFTEVMRTHAVDIQPYIVAGQTNCISIFFQRRGLGPPMSYLHGKVIMTTGQAVLLDMKPSNPQMTWKSTSTEQSGWNQPGFNDAGWSNIQSVSGYADYFMETLENWPAHDGVLFFENPNPNEEKLFFKDNQPIQVNVLIPSGLSGTINWILERVNDGGTYTQISTGSQGSFTNRGNSKVYSLNLGTQPRGVYTLQVSLQSGATTIETRLPEPLVVVRKVSQTTIDATYMEEGLNLQLEAEIDFTTAGGWVETYPSCEGCYRPEEQNPVQVTTPTIIDNGFLRYRQTYSRQHSLFSYQYTFQNPGDWYLLVLDYPDDANRWIGVSVTRLENLPNYEDERGNYKTESGPSVITGIKFPISGDMKQLKWIHRADYGLHTIDVVSLKVGGNAAARRIRIYHIQNQELPAVKSSLFTRRIGIHTESENGYNINFAVNYPGFNGWLQFPSFYSNMNYDMLQRKTQRLLWQLDAMEHYVQYMRFTGQNINVMGTYMYMTEQRSYLPPYGIETAEIGPQGDIRDMALRVFDANNIDMMSTIEYANPLAGQGTHALAIGYENFLNETMPRDYNGNPYMMTGTEQANVLHPWVLQAFSFSMDEIARKFSGNSAWKGFFFLMEPGFLGPFTSPVKIIWVPDADPHIVDYSDTAIAAFEADTGINVPDEPYDSGRYMRRYTFLTSPSYKSTWINWKIKAGRDFILRAISILEKYRTDTFVVQVYGFPESTYYLLRQEGSGVLDYMRELGMDPAAYSNDAKVWTSPYFFLFDDIIHNVGPGSSQYYPSYTGAWDERVNPEIYSMYDTNDKRVAVFREGWEEINYNYVSLSNPPAWPISVNVGRFQGKNSEPYSREGFVYSMIGADPQMIIHGFNDVGLSQVYGQEYRDFSKIFTELPASKFQTVLGTGFNTNLAIRELQEGGTYWFYVVNPGYWPAQATLNLRNINSVVDVANGQAVSVPGGVLSLNMEPYGIRAFRAATSTGGVNSYSIAQLSERDIAHMRNLIYYAKNKYVLLKSFLGMSINNESFMLNTADQAEQDLANKQYASAWQKLTNWRYWSLAYDTVFRAASLISNFNKQQAGSLRISFDGAASATYGEPIVSYQWNFGDGTTGSGRTVNHTYSSSGIYTVKLTITDRTGKTDTGVKNIAVTGGANPADLNINGVVDIYDLSIVTLDFGKTSGYDPVADIVTDGEIDIYDVVFVASRFGELGDIGGGGTPLPSGQVAYWSFDNTLTDGQGINNGTFYGGTPSYVAGKVGTALRFDGVDDYVRVPNHDSLNPGSGITISAWIKFTDDDTQQPVVARGDSSNGYQFGIMSSGGSLYLRTMNSGASSDVFKFIALQGDWHHVTATFNSTHEVIYADGFPILSETPSITSIGSSSMVLNIGGSQSGMFWNQYMNGDIDEVRIFNRSLTAGEVINVMYKGLPPS